MRRDILFVGLVLTALFLFGCPSQTSSCSTSANCPSGFVCTNGNCTALTCSACSASNPCPANQVCTRNGTCVAGPRILCALPNQHEVSSPPCPSSQTCADNYVAPGYFGFGIGFVGIGTCTGPTTCFDCSASNPCPTNQVCTSGICTKPSLCIACSASNPCSTNQTCINGTCAPTPTLTWCTTDTTGLPEFPPCPSAQTCYAFDYGISYCISSFTCAKCSASNPCPANKTCTNGVCTTPLPPCIACSAPNSCQTNQACINGTCSTGLINLCGTSIPSERGEPAQTIPCPNGEVCGNTSPLIMGDPGSEFSTTFNVGICIVPRTCSDCSADNPCPTNLTCINGFCTKAPACALGQILCNGVCVNNTIDLYNCGKCGLKCASNQNCTNSICTNQTTNPTMCSDTDSGINFSVKGTVTSSGVSFTDYCASNSAALIEFYCLNGTVMNKTADCPYGCSNGACMNQTSQPNCTDTDGGVNYYQTGTVVSSAGNFTDFCSSNASGNFLVEYYCKGTNELNTTFFCPANMACINGACIATAPQCVQSGQSCVANSPNGGCCSGLTCDSSGNCNTPIPACIPNGETCSAASNNCCEGFSCNAASGTCAPNCSSGQVACNGLCVNYANDPNNCGSCGVECSPGQNCTNGACVTPTSSCFQSGHQCIDALVNGGCCSGTCNPLNNLCQ